MSLQYNKINISLNGVNILCDSLSINEQALKKPQYGINYSLPFDYVPDSLKSTLNITYYMEVSGEPNYTIISGLKANNFTGNNPAVFNLGTIKFTGYLNKLSFEVAPLQTIKTQATYDIFNPLTGLLNQGNISDGNLYNLTNASGLSNYFSAYLYSGGTQILNSNILQLTYDFNCNIIPIYSIGNPYPIQVYISDAYEQLNTISELQNNKQFSGQNLINLLGVDTLILNNQSSTWGDNINQINFPISGMKHTSEKFDITTSNLILFQDQWQQSF